MTAPASSRWRPWAVRLAALAVLTLLFGLALARFPDGAAIEARESRDMAIDYALRHGAQLGADLLILEGPLAGLDTGTHSTLPLWPQFWWQLFFNLALGAALAWVTLRMPRPQRWFFLLSFLLVAAYRPAAAHAAVLLLGGVMLIGGWLRRREAVPAGLLLGTLGLLEVPFFVLGAAAVLAALAVPGQSRSAAALAGGAWIAAVLGGWKLAGQAWSHLPAWLANGVMTWPGREALHDEAIWTLPVGLAAAAVAATALGVVAAGRQWRRPAGVALAGFSLLALWLLWLRQLGHLDGRPQDWFAIGWTWVAGWVAVRPVAPGRTVWTVLAVLTSAAGIASSEPRILTQPLIVLNQHWVEGVARFGDKSAWQRSVRQKTRDTAAVFELARTRAEAAGAPTDLLSDTVGYAPLSGLTYRPRPTIQSITAVGQRQLWRNAEFFQSARAPELVVQRFSAPAGWLPASADAPSLLALYFGYDFAFEDRTFLVWRRRAGAADIPSLAPHRTLPAAWGQPVALNLDAQHGYWLRFDLRRTPWGALRRWFWPVADFALTLRDHEGNQFRYRIGADAARAGFLLHPFFRGEMDIIRYQARLPTPLVAQITAEAGTALRQAWRLESVELHQLPLPPANGRTETAEAIATRYRMSNRLPQSVTTLYPPAPVDYEGREVLLVSPEGSLEFPVHPGDTRVSGQFGVVENAYTNGNASDGVEFVVEYHPVAGEPRELMRRNLDPLNEPRDRGLQSFAFALPGPASGRLILRTTNAPGRNGAYDWSFWTDLRFE